MSYIWMFVLQRSFLWPDSYTGIFPRRATANEYKKAVIWLSGHTTLSKNYVSSSPAAEISES